MRPSLCTRSTITACLLAASVFAGCSRPDSDERLVSAVQRMERGDVDGAIIDARNALSQDDKSPLGRYTLARALLANGDPEAAEIELRRAASLGHSEREVAALMARLLNEREKHAEVIERYGQDMVERAQNNPDLAAEVARAHAEQGDRDSAQAALGQVLAAAPRHAQALLLRAELLATAGDAAQALRIVDDVLSREPAHPDAWTARGRLLAMDAARRGEAAQAFRRALERQPRSLRAHTGLLGTLLAAGATKELEAGVRTMQQALPAHPTTVYFSAIAALQRGDLRAARQGAQLLMRGAENELRVVYLAGLVEARLGNPVQAESLLTRAVHIAPEVPEPRRELASLYAALGQGERALQTLAPLMSATSDDALAWRIAGQAHLRKGDFGAADAAFARAAQLRPDDPGLRLDVARSLLMRGQQAAGLRELNAVAESSRQADADLALVSVHMARKDVPAALGAARAMADKLPHSPLPDLVRGRILQSAGDRTGALQAYEAALAKQANYLPAVSSLAAMDLEAHQPAAARRRYEAVLRSDPQQAEAMLALAAIVRREGAPRAEANRWLDKAVAANALETAVWRQAIEHHRRDGDVAGALARAQAAIVALPNDPVLLAELAATQLAAKEALQAIASLNRLVQLLPHSADAYLRLAQAQLDAGNVGAARHNVRRATQIAPDWPPTVHAEVALALAVDRDVERALEVARRTQAKSPHQALGWSLQGQIEAHRGHWPAAVGAFRTALDKQPAPDTAIALHRALLAAGDAAGARALADRWARTQAHDLAFPVYLAEAADRAGDLTAAEARYRELVRRHPDDARLVNNLAYVLVRRKDRDALELAEQAHRLAPYRPEVIDTLAAAHALGGNAAAAAEWQAKAVELQPQDAALRLTLTRYLIAANRKDRARNELRALARFDATPEQRATAEALLREIGR